MKKYLVIFVLICMIFVSAFVFAHAEGASVVAESIDVTGIRFDGVYCRAYEDKNDVYEVIRLFDNGTAIINSSNDIPSEDTFVIENKDLYEKGNYTISKDHIEIVATSDYSIATYEYEGEIEGDTVLLNFHNTYSDRREKNVRYYFISFEKIKKDNTLASIRYRTGPIFESGIASENTLEMISYELPDHANRSLQVKADNHKVAVKKRTKITAEVKKLSDDAPPKSTLNWMSLDENVATVNNQGVVQGVSAGTAKIVCSLSDEPDNKATIIIQVIEPIKKLTSVEKKILMQEGQTTKWEILITPEDATEKQLLYSSSNDCVVILEDGTVVALKKGKAKLTAESNDGSGKKVVVEAIVEPDIPLTAESVTFSRIDDTYFGFIIKNHTTTKTIINLDFSYTFYDYNGNIVNAGEWKKSRKDFKLGPGKEKELAFSIFGASQAYKTELTILAVMFSDKRDYFYPQPQTWTFVRK